MEGMKDNPCYGCTPPKKNPNLSHNVHGLDNC